MANEIGLAALDPRWVVEGDRTKRSGMGVSFKCPHCARSPHVAPTRIIVWFSNPIDGGKPWAEVVGLQSREGETFETLSIDGLVTLRDHWRGTIKNGIAEDA